MQAVRAVGGLADVGQKPWVVGSIGCTLNSAPEAGLRQVDVKGKRK